MNDINIEKIEREIDTDGFSIVSDVVSKFELQELRDQIDEALEADTREYRGLPGKKDWIAYDMVSRGSAFIRLLENETMHRVFSHFLGNTCILYSFTSTVMKPNIEQSTAKIHVDAPRIIPGYHSGMLMTLALDDFTEENGATYYLPGSQLRVDPPSEDEFYNNAVRVCRKAGDAVFFNPRVWHAGAPNKTEEVRRGITPYAVRSFMRQRFDYPRMVTKDILDQLGDRGKRFLGFNVRIPSSMFEYYVPAERRLYKANQG